MKHKSKLKLILSLLLLTLLTGCLFAAEKLIMEAPHAETATTSIIR